MLPPLPRTVILDYYDSYTNNLLTLFTKLYTDDEVLRKVVVIKADRYSWDSFQRDVLPNIDCVILSPGPGRPDKPSDIGFGLDLIRCGRVPILGVCLGHQAIGVAFGGKIINTPRITHGHVVPIQPVTPLKGIFASPEWQQSGNPSDEFDVVVYNSLTVDPRTLPEDLQVTAWSAGNAERTIQGLAHKTLPIWGVQYHPESISSTRGAALLHAFLSRVQAHHTSPATFPPLAESIIASCAYRVTASGSLSTLAKRHKLPSLSPYPTPPISPSGSSASLADLGGMTPLNGHPRVANGDSGGGEGSSLVLMERRFGDVGRQALTQDVFEAVTRRGSGKGKEKALGEIWLDGETPTRPTNTSISSPDLLLTYSLSSRTVTLHRSSAAPVSLFLQADTFWDWFAAGQNALSGRLKSSRPNHGFRGGWVGWFGYEMKQESLAGYQRRDVVEGDGEVDAAWAWCSRVLERRKSGEWVARGVIGGHKLTTNGVDEDAPPSLIEWLASLGVEFGLSEEEFQAWSATIESVLADPPSSTVEPISSFPRFQPRSSGEDYRRRIDLCREAIRQGESYELTLTTLFLATTSNHPDPLSLYLHLRSRNPAYYSTYIHLPHLVTPRGKGVTILSSSPERFLRIDEGVVEMMPIKGTRARVKPGMCVCDGTCPGGEACAEIARKADERIGEELRLDPKERAENLMIVDLIRSDLLSACTPSTVTVPKLIALESYGVHNLVTTVRGVVAGNVGTVDAVRRCFPPGSMTGAPKLRSVQMLEGFEDGERRGIYSGCLGYFSLDGTTDLSVVIRTMVLEGDQLYLGAGGAITWLSDPDKEWDEVLTKVRSVVGSLDI